MSVVISRTTASPRGTFPVPFPPEADRAGLGIGRRAERRRVRVEAAEVVERLAGDRARVRPKRRDGEPAAHRRDHRSHVMGDDLQVGKLLQPAGEDEARHRNRGLIRPAERPPDVVLRTLLVWIVGPLVAARRVQPDRLAELAHGARSRASAQRLVSALASLDGPNGDRRQTQGYDSAASDTKRAANSPGGVTCASLPPAEPRRALPGACVRPAAFRRDRNQARWRRGYE